MRNKTFICIGKELKKKHKNADREGIQKAETRLDNIVNIELDKYEEGKFIKMLESNMKTIVMDDTIMNQGITRYMINWSRQLSKWQVKELWERQIFFVVMTEKIGPYP